MLTMTTVIVENVLLFAF